MALKQVTGRDVAISKAFKDIKIDFARNPFTDDVAHVRNDNSIKQALKNLVLTVPGEVPFDNSIGSRVSELLFEPMDELISDALQDEIASTINKFEPRVSLINTIIVPNFETGKYGVTIKYRIVGLPLTESVSFVLQRPE
jgi:phage baseplate assembly protein W|tara:strand:- start:28 stop:447 length:420 start_codon:yes stop_codon:yes gene_type:complete